MLLTTLTVGLTLALADAGCSREELDAGLCSITNTGSTVEIGAMRPGGTGGDDEGSPDGEVDGAAPGPPAPPPACATAPRGSACYSVVVLQPTLEDLASFAPAPTPLLDEPDGVGVVGMPMNFVVNARVHEQTGTLFDRPVTVRFTPASVVFSYGDGTERSAAEGGRTWADLGLAQFSATATSHAYAARGTYTASASVRYSAAVDFGGGWAPVPGLLTIPTGAMSVQIFEVRTALVDRTCVENPGGPGC